ncbi:MAG TPA: PEP-CTERM sorting domain-containing protein [Rhizomicrobium sp.]|nr:PEP-CTERM sorting domain-containing protein [Rhizomicrobium sp.]
MHMLKALVWAAIAATMMSASASANAIYDITLSGTPYTGGGALTLTSAVSTTGTVNVPLANVVGLSFTIDGQTFTYPGTGAALSTVQFFNGALNDITFAQQIGTTPHRYDLQTTGGFIFYYNDEGSLESGSMTATLESTAVVPEPTGLAILGMALLGLAGFAFIQRRKVIAAV